MIIEQIFYMNSKTIDEIAKSNKSDKWQAILYMQNFPDEKKEWINKYKITIEKLEAK